MKRMALLSLSRKVAKTLTGQEAFTMIPRVPPSLLKQGEKLNEKIPQDLAVPGWGISARVYVHRCRKGTDAL
jgi:hypothetical protein